MRMVFENLYVGNQFDYENGVFLPSEWAFCLAAKEPWHRSELGYVTRGAPKESPEYSMALRGNKLILNLVDAPKPEFFDKRIIDAALSFIDARLKEGKKVLTACNLGESRSPSIALLFLIKHGIIRSDTLEDCEAEFMKVYPQYNPGTGMRGFVKQHWMEYMYSDCIIGIDLGKGNSKTGFAKKLHNRMKHINPELFKKEYLAEFTKVDEETEKAIEEKFSDGHLKEHWKEYL